jgi:hypothetical protein
VSRASHRGGRRDRQWPGAVQARRPRPVRSLRRAVAAPRGSSRPRASRRARKPELRPVHLRAHRRARQGPSLPLSGREPAQPDSSARGSAQCRVAAAGPQANAVPPRAQGSRSVLVRLVPAARHFADQIARLAAEDAVAAPFITAPTITPSKPTIAAGLRRPLASAAPSSRSVIPDGMPAAGQSQRRRGRYTSERCSIAMIVTVRSSSSMR